MKGIILAGGAGSRLFPITNIITKQLLPIYNKPMIYYPLSTLMLSGIKDILIISTPSDTSKFEELLGDGENFGIKLSYKIQKEPKGIAEAFILGEDFIGNEEVCLVLGDNIFNGLGISELLFNSVNNAKKNNMATVFGYYVSDPQRYGVVEFDSIGNALSIEEKPLKPKSNYAVVGLYFYPNSVLKIAKQITPSKRGELEITSINNTYLKRNELNVELMGKGFTWLDTGTPDSLLEASNFIQAIEKRQGLKVACIEQIVFNKGYINSKQLNNLTQNLSSSEYGQYLLNLTSK